MTDASAPAGRYLGLLAERMAKTRTALCLGVDPDPDALPDGFSPDVRGIEAFARLLIEAAGPHVAAVKANLAFFEAWGSDGMAALERIRAAVPQGVPFIADAKRGDIGSTSEAHATAIFDRLGADAVTASPYLGSEAIAPLLDRTDRFVYVLCRTSNPGAGEFQHLIVRDPDGPRAATGAEPLFLHVARRARAWAGGRGNVGLVVGATAPQELGLIRTAAPELAFLVPGIGRQGGDVAAVVAAGPATEGLAGAAPGGGLLVNISRAIAETALGAADPGVAIAAAAESWAARLRV